MFKVTLSEPVVSVDWLYRQLKAENLIIFDASIPKITETNNTVSKDIQLPNAQFLNLKECFSDVSSAFPNTIPSAEQFQTEARKLGVNADSAIVVYDDKGIYSSARVWWLFKTFGHNNIAVLDGGLPEWLAQNYPTETSNSNAKPIGDFETHFNPDNVTYFKDLEKLSHSEKHTIVDARSAARFYSQIPEPRAGLRSGTIPNSKNMPFEVCLENGKLKPKVELQEAFKALSTKENTVVFSCGSGLTACILDLAANVANYKHTTVYDGSWTEYGTLTQ
ncbi:sulfurtransferase [Bizionia gelidisalsuginis]|uniref:Sulfurtransferase n=1 Tax=Bizionia gelidisalsuginis TaxID=291188 RepID=A0ABY3MBV9_9FLAO|nr:sulfurtransferase [Bizionia gelidisalsuginis]TYC14184.1 sulfurtransferase [Bizionia gelidisalsuginis]